MLDSLSTGSYSSTFIEDSFISKLINKKLPISDEKRAKALWSLYGLEVWKNGHN